MKSYFLVFCSFIAGRPAFACMRTGTSNYSNGEMTVEWLNDYEYVFTGKLITVETAAFDQKVMFKTASVLKGNITDTMTFVTPYLNTSCGIDYSPKIDQSFIVFAKVDNGRLSTHFCYGTKELKNQDVIDTSLASSDEWTKLCATRDLQILKFIEYFQGKYTGKSKFNYSSRQKQAIGKLRKGIPIDEWTYYTYSGNLKAIGSYLDGKRNGIWLEYHYNYVTEDSSDHLFYIDEGHYLNGEKTGVWKSYYYDMSDSLEYIREYDWNK